MKLYQQLNEARTQGEMAIKHIEIHKMYGIYCDGEMVGKIYDKQGEQDSLTKDEAKANAKYTALAVNNLHHLAEALDKLIEANRKGEAQGTNWINAQQALSRIS